MSSGERLGMSIVGREHLRVEESAWPRVTVCWPAGIREDHEVEAALAQLRDIAARDEDHVVLVDAREARPPSPAQLGKILECVRAVGPTSRCLAIAIVSRSPVVRATVDSIRWCHLIPARWAHFDELEHGEAWLERMLERHTEDSAVHRIGGAGTSRRTEIRSARHQRS